MGQTMMPHGMMPPYATHMNMPPMHMNMPPPPQQQINYGFVPQHVHAQPFVPSRGMPAGAPMYAQQPANFIHNYPSGTPMNIYPSVPQCCAAACCTLSTCVEVDVASQQRCSSAMCGADRLCKLCSMPADNGHTTFCLHQLALCETVVSGHDAPV